MRLDGVEAGARAILCEHTGSQAVQHDCCNSRLLEATIGPSGLKHSAPPTSWGWDWNHPHPACPP